MRNNHYAAFLARAAAGSLAYHTRDAAPSLMELKEAQDGIMQAFDAFMKKNDERLKELAEKGSADPLLTEQMDRMTTEINELKEVGKAFEKFKAMMARPGGGGDPLEKNYTPEQIEHRQKFLDFLRHPDDEQAKAHLQEIQKRAVSTTSDGAGGYAVPEIISRMLEEELTEIASMRGIVRVVEAGSKDYKELVDVKGTTYGWVGETDARPETNTGALEEVAPTFGTIYAYPKATEESLDDIFFNVEQWIINSALEAFEQGEENAIINGNGTKKPTGFLNGTPTAQKDGTRNFGVLQYVPGGHASLLNDASADKLILLVQSLKKGYRARARWMLNKLTVGTIMTLKDGDGNYLWKMGDIRNGQPDRIHGYPVTESEEMPDVAANAFPIAFGDFYAGYVLVPLVGLRITRDEVTTPGYIKWYVRRRLGGNVAKSEAIKLIKVAAS